jgi:dienelactone hydrolase
MKYCTLFLVAFASFAQPKPAVTPADFGKWETLGAPVLSHDGKWLAASVRRNNGTAELRVYAIAGGAPKTAVSGSEPAFSSDSRWVAYAVGYSEAEEDKLKKARKPLQNKLGIMDLTTGTTSTIDDVIGFSFSDQGAWLAFRRYPPSRGESDTAAGGGRGGRGGGGASSDGADPVGAPLTVRDLKTGADTTFGNVTTYAWQDKGSRLAMTIGVDGREGNAVQLFDPANGALRVLDSGNAVFSSLVWRKDSGDLAALRSVKNKEYEGESHSVLAWKNLTGKAVGDVAAPKRIVGSRAPQWSEDGATIFIGIADWDKKIEAVKSDEDPSNVEVWHPRDVNVISQQKLQVARDRDRHVVGAWQIAANRIVPLGTNNRETMQIPRTGGRALAVDDTPYDSLVMFGRRFADPYSVDLASGARTRLGTKLAPPFFASPSGKYMLNFKDGEFYIYDLAANTSKNVSRAAGVSFVNKEDDHPNPTRPAWGVAGWTKNDASVIVYDEFDLWELFPDGAKPRRLTDGAADQVRHRYVDPEVARRGGRGGRGGFNADAEPIDLSKPVYLSVYGEWNKKSGFARLVNGKVERTVWVDRNTGGLAKAKDADVYVYNAEAFDVPTNYFAAAGDLQNPHQVTDSNSFAKDYAWGKAELIEYKSPKGERLQGALFAPANYDPAKKYPLIVHIYERESQFLHRYFPLTERSPYTEAVWTANGYFVLMPDIVFRPRDPGMSVVECVTAATKKVLESGRIDPKRVGLIGHSWGGFGTAFVLTQTDVFTAGVAGGPLTDLVSSYGEIYWNSGTPETDHAEVGQERMEVPLYEDPASFLRNSAVFHVNKMKGALLLSVGDKDGASDWHQDIEMYNLARRAGKQCIMLVYPGENHGLAVKANQMDYHRRILDWFDHYLKDQAPKPWIDHGVSVVDREKELKRIKKSDSTPQ